MKIKISTITKSAHSRKNKKILAITAVLALVLFLGTKKTLAQSTTENSKAAFGDPIEVITVATVNIYDAKIISQEGNRIKIGFDLDNREGVQPGIKYSVELIRTESEGDDETQTVVDEKVYDEKVSLGENETVHREIEYTAPSYLSGDFTVYLSSKTDKGMGLAIAKAGEINLKGSGQFIEIMDNYCYLTIKGEASEKKYFLDQGVDISKEETLLANCKIKSNFSNNINATPNFAIYYRDTYGEKISETKQASINIISGEEKNISLEIPKAEKPQAYDAVLTFSDEKGNVISNEVNFHYVLQGKSATIQNLILDKEYYQKGDTANLSVLWDPSADTFFGARGKGNREGGENMDILIEDAFGKNCSEKNNVKLDFKKSPQVFGVAIKKECVDPKAILTLKDKNGNILDSSEYQVKSKVAEDVSEKGRLEKAKKVFYAFSIILVLLVISYIIVKKKTSAGSLKILLFMFTIGFFAFGFGQRAKGDSFAINYGCSDQCVEYYPCDSEYSDCVYNPQCKRYEWQCFSVNFYGNLNKKNYQPGETITVTGKMPYLGICSNNGWYRTLSVSMPNYSNYTLISGEYMDEDCGKKWWLSTECKKKVVASAYFAAPSVPGNYEAVFYAYANHAGTAEMRVPFKVNCRKPPVPNPGPGYYSYISKSEVEQGGEFEIRCDYGVITNGIDATVGGGGSCGWTGWVGTAASFKCTAGNTPGSRNVNCIMRSIASDYYCSGTDNIGTINVIGNSAPTAKIDVPSENPSSAEKNAEMPFSGQGTDTDGSIKLHRWFKDDQCTQNPVTLEYSCVGTPMCKCSGDPMVCESNPSMQGISGCTTEANNPSKSSLRAKFSSVGQHNIFYQVQDNKNKWSNFDTRVINVTDPEYSLTVNIAPQEGGTVRVAGKKGSETRTETCNSSSCTFSFNKGTVTLTASPKDEYGFEGWSGGGLASSGNPASFTIKADKTTTAQFEKNSCTPDEESCENNAKDYCEGVLFPDSRCNAYICEGTKKCTGWQEVKR